MFRQSEEQLRLDAIVRLEKHIPGPVRIPSRPPELTHPLHEIQVTFPWLQDQFNRLRPFALQQCFSNGVRRNLSGVSEPLQAVVVDESLLFYRVQRLLHNSLVHSDLAQGDLEAVTAQLSELQCFRLECEVTHVHVLQSMRSLCDLLRIPFLDAHPLTGVGSLVLRSCVGKDRGVHTGMEGDFKTMVLGKIPVFLLELLSECVARLHRVQVEFVQHKVSVLAWPGPFSSHVRVYWRME